MLTSYTVTFRGSPTERLSPHALDEVKGLDNALTHALNLIRAGHQDVAIQDGMGKSVSGDLLMACCRGEKELTPDLFSWRSLALLLGWSNSSTVQGGGKRRPVIAEYFFVLIEIA
jgi:hypothetical protein